MTILTEIIRNEDGEPVMTDELTLPIDVMTESIKLIGEHLGK